MTQIDNKLSTAIVQFTGYGSDSHPGEHPDRIAQNIGEKDAAELENRVGKLFYELDQLKPDWSSHNLSQAGVWAKNKMHITHPELSDEALNALEWTFTWWWK